MRPIHSVPSKFKTSKDSDRSTCEYYVNQIDRDMSICGGYGDMT